MAEGTAGTDHLQRASIVVTVSAAAAAGYLLLLDANSNWVDWLMGWALVVLTVYGVRSVFRPLDEEIVPPWRPRNFWDVVAPFVFPFFLASWAEDLGSRLAWLGWALLAAAFVIQLAMWRRERSDGGVSTPEAGAAHL